MTEKSFLGGRRGWLAMGTLAAYAMVGSSKLAMAAVSKDGKVAGTACLRGANLPVKRFNIAAGPLDVAIAAYEAQTGLKVTTSLPAGTLAGFQTKGVTGLYPEEEALRLLLEGTGLQLCAAGCDDDGGWVAARR